MKQGRRTTALPWEGQAVYRVLAKRAHPAAGGSHEAMKTVNLAYDQAMTWAEQHQVACLTKASDRQSEQDAETSASGGNSE